MQPANRRRAWVVGGLMVATAVGCFVINRKEELITKFSIVSYWGATHVARSNTSSGSSPSTVDTPGNMKRVVDTGRTNTTSSNRTNSGGNLASSSLAISQVTQDKYRVIDTSRLNRTKGWALFSRLSAAGELDFRGAARYPVTDEWMTPLEREILQDEQLQSLDSVAAPGRSSLVLVSPSQNGNVTVGDKVTVRVDLKDARGKRVRKGGHFVRVWMVQHHGGHDRALAAEVTDMRNGSYVASLPVLWNGSIEVRAAMVRSREFRRVMLNLKRTMKMTNQNVAAFVSNKTEQVTLCSFVPIIPGFPEVCNLTDANSGLPWYCGKPNKTKLDCGHWAWSSHTSFPRRYPASKEDNMLLQRCASSSKALQLGLLRRHLNLTSVKGKEPTEIANKSCVPGLARDSWTDQSPRGFWDNQEWHSLVGCPLPRLNGTRVKKCFQDTHVIFLGDSNARAVFQVLTKVLAGCKPRPDPRKSYHPNMLHVPFHYDCPHSNTSVSWYPHAYPFFSGSGQWSDVRVKQAPSVVLDKLPSTGKYVILIHLFIHFSPLHISIYAHHVRNTARAVRDLLARNPKVKVFVRGPHAVLGGRFQLSSDMFTEQCIRVLKHEFRHLRDHVIFLNTWDMTIANENVGIHPKMSVVTTLSRLMLAHVCPTLK
ncbi:NXPE family member 3-like [Littorina saxatilis]|uniref:NXPE family member 3-like n=1 Tax=Littorina saxatilis TaxID=31220 RepID=UPI0038B5AB36